MSKNQNGYGKGTFVQSKYYLSPAWLSLGLPKSAPVVSGCSCQVLMLFLGKRQFAYRKDKKGKKVWERVDDNRFTLTYKELEARGISQKRATRAIDELLAKGFISIVDPGGAYEKHKAVYALEDGFRSWRPGDLPVRKRRQDVKRGFQNKNNGRSRRSPTRTRKEATP